MICRAAFKALLCLLPLSGVPPAHGQTGGWEAVKRASSGAGGLIDRKGKQLGAIRQSLLQRGLDSGSRNQLFLAGRLHSDGYGVGFFYTRRIDARRSHLVSFMFSEVKDEKERRQQRTNNQYPELGRGTPFIFGKEYNLYAVQLTCGQQRILLPSLLEGNAAVGLRWGAGISLNGKPAKFGDHSPL